MTAPPESPGFVYVRLERVEGYEDVHPELLIEDAAIKLDFNPTDVTGEVESLRALATPAAPTAAPSLVHPAVPGGEREAYGAMRYAEGVRDGVASERLHQEYVVGEPAAGPTELHAVHDAEGEVMATYFAPKAAMTFDEYAEVNQGRHERPRQTNPAEPGDRRAAFEAWVRTEHPQRHLINAKSDVFSLLPVHWACWQAALANQVGQPSAALAADAPLPSGGPAAAPVDRDAERYRWLRNRPRGPLNGSEFTEGLCIDIWDAEGSGQQLTGAEADIAIDAALAASPTPPEAP